MSLPLDIQDDTTVDNRVEGAADDVAAVDDAADDTADAGGDEGELGGDTADDADANAGDANGDDADDDADAPAGEPVVSSNYKVRLLIDAHQVGAIIGKGGANIAATRAESGTFMSILKAESPDVRERVMEVKGSIAAVLHAIQLVADRLVAVAQEHEEKDGLTSNLTTTTSLKLLVHKSVVGAIIGRGGAVIRQTQEDSGARVQVSNDLLPRSTEKTCQVSGTPSDMATAIELIFHQITENPLREHTRVVPYVPLGPSAMYGNGGGYGYGGQGHYDSYSGGGRGGGYRGGGGYDRNNDGGGESSVQKLLIPSACAGGVIGKGGSNIRNLMAMSNANITIAESDDQHPTERMVTVTGAPQATMQAMFLVRQLVDQYPSGGRGGRGRDNYDDDYDNRGRGSNRRNNGNYDDRD